MTRVVPIVLALAATGCPEAPETLALEAQPRAIALGDWTVRIKLPEGIEHHQTTKTSTRYRIPGRGGAIVHLSLRSGTPKLADRVKAVENGPNLNGAKPIVVRQDEKGDRGFLTTQGHKGWAVAASSWMPLPAGGSSPHKTVVCRANVGRSRPIADLEGTRKTLEAICESMQLVEP